MLGTLGPLAFKVSNKQIRTFKDLKASHSAKYAEHAIIGRKALLEFIGFGATTMSMTIRLDHTLGVKPYEELQKFRAMFKSDEPFNFVLGGKPVGENKWVIEGYDIDLETFTDGGHLAAAVISVKLKEYIELNEEKR